MSSEELDKFFKERLEEISHEPSVNAWSSVQAQMDNKKGLWFYLRIAAAILLLVSFAGLYFMNSNSENAPDRSLAENNPSEKVLNNDTLKIDSIKSVEKVKEPSHSMDNNIASIDTINIEEPVKKVEGAQKAVTKNTNLAIIDEKKAIEKTPIQNDSIPQAPGLKDLRGDRVLIAENAEPNATPEADNASDSQKEVDSGSTLIFDIEDFDVKTAVTQAYDAAEETKKSGFKKVLDFVKSVKEGEAGLGGLREAKNSLLSIKQKDKEDGNSR